MSEDVRVQLPAYIRAMINPYKNIMRGGWPDTIPTALNIETTYIPESSRPTEKQLHAIGRVITTFSVLERVFGIVLARLSLAPDFPAMALTKDLSLDNHLKALKTLLALHADRYLHQISTPDLSNILTNMGTEFARVKDERNVVVHSTWYSSGADKIVSLAARPSTERKSAAFPQPVKTVTELNDLADRIQRLSDAMFIIVQLLPEVDEVRHARSLSQAPRLHLPETQTEPEDPPQPSGA
jgi:hypothetical protein